MSIWIPSPELSKEYMDKRNKLFENVNLSIYSSENRFVFHKACFNKCIKDFSSSDLSISERNCMIECKILGDQNQKELLRIYADIM